MTYTNTAKNLLYAGALSASRRAGSQAVGYLMGKPRTTRASSNLGPRIRRLEAQISKHRPELQQFRNNLTETTVVSPTNTADIDISRIFVDSPQFRDKVSGDRWVNKQLILNIHANDSGPGKLRIICYTPLRPDVIFAPATNYFYTQPLDHTAWKVHYDKTFNKRYAVQLLSQRCIIDLGNMQTLYNSDADNFDRNNVKLKLIWQSTTAQGLNISYEYYFTDK